VVVAGRTMEAFASRARDVTATLGQLPGALSATEETFSRLDSSASGLDRLFAALRPGAALLPALARRLHVALLDLSAVARPLASTVSAAITGAPAITAFLDAAAPFLGHQLAPALRRLTPMVACVAPYTPELAGFLSNWASATQYYDHGGHYGRFHIIEGPTSMVGLPLTPAQAAAFPGIVYSRARPPGFDAGQTWYIPGCGVGTKR
jgi:phospholipid/cholesterol/gamma-HCH transport system substrate-binding protein